jgi:hypothetical protein
VRSNWIRLMTLLPSARQAPCQRIGVSVSAIDYRQRRLSSLPIGYRVMLESSDPVVCTSLQSGVNVPFGQYLPHDRCCHHCLWVWSHVFCCCFQPCTLDRCFQGIWRGVPITCLLTCCYGGYMVVTDSCQRCSLGPLTFPRWQNCKKKKFIKL